MSVYRASAPGSLMICGEHAVLYNEPAIVCALDKRITVTMMPRADDRINIVSTQLGSYQTTLSQLTPQKPFHFILNALATYKNELPSGCDMSIESEFSAELGFGSSAAVSVATLAAIGQWCAWHDTPVQLFERAMDVVKRTQGLGSGADVAASVLGGVVYYRQAPHYMEQIAQKLPLSVVYSGHKVPTVTVVKQVQARVAQNRELYQSVFTLLGQCTREAANAVRFCDWVKLGELWQVHHGLQVALGVSNVQLASLIARLNQHKSVMGAKISGAGLGDCVIALGKFPIALFPENPAQYRAGIKGIAVDATDCGVKIE